MTARRVVLLRHGLTDWNNRGLFQGQADVSLNDVGRGEAADAAEQLAGYGFDRVVASDLSRAAETARIVAAACGLDIEADPRLREIDVGAWEGLNEEEVKRIEPDFWPALREGRDFRRSPQGETATEAGQRVAAALLDHAAAAGEHERLLAVGHGLSMRIATMLLMGLDYSHARLFGGLGNCHWIELRPGADYWRLLTYNQGSA